jgi:hypothetical protein
MAARALDFKVDITPAMLRLGKLPDEVRNALKAELNVLATKVRDKAKENAATMFQVRTGHYLASIRKSVRASKTSVVARVYSNDPKAHLLERGVKPHDIRAVNATELAFLSFFGLSKFAKMVHHPGMQGHAVISTAFFDVLGEIEVDLTEAVQRAAKENAAQAPAAAEA